MIFAARPQNREEEQHSYGICSDSERNIFQGVEGHEAE